MSENSSEYITRHDGHMSISHRTIQIVIWISLAIVFVIIITDYARYIFDISFFKSSKTLEPMKPVAALCFGFSVLNLLILKVNLPALTRKLTSIFIASSICAVSLITLYVYVYFYLHKPRIESPLTQLSYVSFFLTPSHLMPFLTAINFLFIGCIFFLFSVENEYANNVAHLLTIPVFLISYFIIVSYILEVYSATEVKRIPVSLDSGLAFCGLGTAILFMRPDTWLIKMLFSKDTAGIISRKLLPPLLILPVIIGWLRIHGEQIGMFKSEEGVVLVAVAYTTCFLVLIWHTARSIERIDRKQRSMEKELRESESRLKELVATKDKFFNIVAHDLKNPFTSLLGSSELLYNNIHQMATENIRELALILNDSAKGGYAILQNLLDWSRSETGLLKFNPENINLKIIVDENIENLQLQVTNKEINLTSELTEDFFIFTDKNMINTVLRNLLSNAVKYTFKNGKVIVKVTRNPEESIITVMDSGIGISKEKVESLFRIENSVSLPGTEKEQGTGLGLKLCKEFTERMGGRIWVESEAGRGSSFKFTIPMKSKNA